MKLFRYRFDPLCCLALLAFTINEWVLKPRTPSGFVHGYFNDILLIPCALPVILLVYRGLALRSHSLPPRGKEIVIHLVIWSIVCEGIGPLVFQKATGDWLDVLAWPPG